MSDEFLEEHTYAFFRPFGGALSEAGPYVMMHQFDKFPVKIAVKALEKMFIVIKRSIFDVCINVEMCVFTLFVKRLWRALQAVCIVDIKNSKGKQDAYA